MDQLSSRLEKSIRPLGVCILLALGQMFSHAAAQTSVAPQPAPQSTALAKQADGQGSKSVLNGFAETLQPKAKKAAALQNAPYQPIKKPDDQSQIPEIEMFVGESRVFPTPGVARIAVGNGQILSAAALDDKEVILFANGVGTSSLFVWNADGRYQRVKINIVPGDTTRFAREIAAFLTTIPNAKASIIGDKVIVEGDNLNDLDLARIEDLAKHYPQIVNFTNRLGWEQMVMMDVKVVEFPINELRELGLKWNATGGAAVAGIWSPFRKGDQSNLQIGIQTGQTNSIPITNVDGSTNGIPVPQSLNVLSAINLGLNAQLNLLEQNGKATILSEPQLSARNGAKANFLAGGEYPYTVSTINGPTVLFKPYGIKLEIVPRVDRTGVIRATVDTEVSSIDPSLSTPSGPALLTRRTNTEFNVRNGETLVLSGLLSRRTSQNLDKVPFLGDIPILGALFRSKRFQNDETELVVFVTPRVVDAHSPGMGDRVERTTQRLQDNLGKPPYLSNPIQPDRDASRFDQVSPRAPVSVTPPRDEKTSGEAVPPVDARPIQAAVISTVPAATSPAANPFDAASVANTGSSAETAGSTLQVIKEGLAVLQEPQSKSAPLLLLGRGSLVRITATGSRHIAGETWRHVLVGNIQGWVQGKGVEPAKLKLTTQSNSREPIALTDQLGAEVGLGNPDIRVAGTNAKPATANAPKLPASGTGQRYRVTVQGLAMRVTPDVNSPVLQRLSKGEVVEALPQSPQGYWLPVETGGKRGWVANQWLVQEHISQ